MTAHEPALVRFADRLREAVAAGMPVDAELRAMARATRRVAWRRRLERAAAAVQAGRGLAEALADAGFPSRFCALVALGEGEGRLDDVLAALADEARQRWRLERQLRIATLYPLALLVFAGVIVAAVATVLLPAVRSWLAFSTVDGGIVRQLLAARDALGVGGLLAVSLALPLLLVALFATYGGRRLLARLPGARGLARLLAADRLLTALRVAVGTARAPAAAFQTAAAATGLARRWGRATLDAIAVRLAEGGALGPTLREAGVLPPLVAYVLELAETSSGLPTALDEARATARDELEVRTRRVAVGAGVGLLALVGLFVVAAGLVITLGYGAILEAGGG